MTGAHDPDRIDILHHLMDSPTFLGMDLSHLGITRHVWMMWIASLLLIVLMITFAGSAQEERLDRVVKELEAEQRDAIKHQTDTLHEVLGGNRHGSGSGGGGGGFGSDSIADYEEQRLLDEVLSMMIKEAERKRSV